MPTTDPVPRRYRLLDAVRDAAFAAGGAWSCVLQGKAGMAGLYAQVAAHAIYEKFPAWRSLR